MICSCSNMSVSMQRRLDSRVATDAESQLDLQLEGVTPEHSGDYVTRSNIPSLNALNPALRSDLDHRGIVNIGPYQETSGQSIPIGTIPDAAAAASAEEDVPEQEVRFSPDAASGASVTDLSTTPVMKIAPVRSVSSMPPVNTQAEVTLNRSVSARSYRSQFGEDTMHLNKEIVTLSNMSNANQTKLKQEPEYVEVEGIGRKLYRVYLKDVLVPDDKIPVRFKDQYDIALLYADDDYEEAMGLRSFIEKFCITDTGDRPKVCTIDNNPDMMEGSKIQHIEDAMRISTYVFLFITKTFCTDRWAALQKDECLMASLRDPDKRWCIVPVLTQRRGEPDITKAYSIPFGLQSLKPIDISRITWGQNLKDLMRDDPEDGVGVILCEREVKKRDKFFLSFFNAMLSRKLPIRRAREEQVAMAREMFIKDEQRCRALEKAKQMAEEDARKLALQREKETFQKQLHQRVESGEITESPHSMSHGKGSYNRENVTHVEGGTTYHYHFYNAEGMQVPPMPPAKQTTVNVEGGNIVQVGDYNTATALTADQDDDIYVPDNDVPLMRHLPKNDARTQRHSPGADTDKRTEEESSDSECGEDLYQSQVSNKEALFYQEEYARRPMMEEAKSVGYEFDEIHSTQAKEEASIRLNHQSNPGSTHLKDSPATVLEKELSGLTLNPSSHSQEYALSATGLKNICQEELRRGTERISPGNSVDIPSAPRSRHIRPAQGSPTEDDSGNNLPKLFIQDQSNNSSFTGRNIGDIDTNLDLMQRSTSYVEVKRQEDLPSISERVVLGQEGEMMNAVQPTVTSMPGAGRAQSHNDSTNLSLQMSLLKDVVEEEKKEAQSRFAEQYFNELLDQSDSNVGDNCTTEGTDSHVISQNYEVPEKKQAQGKAKANSQTFALENVTNDQEYDDMYSTKRSVSSADAPSLSVTGSESSLASLQNYVERQQKDISVTTPSNETENSLSLDELAAFVEGEHRDMERPRPIQQISLDALTEMDVDGNELPSGLWSICYAYPHHIDSQYALGRPITMSIKNDDGDLNEGEEDFD